MLTTFSIFCQPAGHFTIPHLLKTFAHKFSLNPKYYFMCSKANIYSKEKAISEF